MEKRLEELQEEEKREEEKLKEIRAKITEIQKDQTIKYEGKCFHEKEDGMYDFYYKVLKVHNHGRWNGEHWCLNPAQATVMVLDKQWKQELDEDEENLITPFSIEIMILDKAHGVHEWEEIPESVFQTVLLETIEEIKNIAINKKDEKT